MTSWPLGEKTPPGGVAGFLCHVAREARRLGGSGRGRRVSVRQSTQARFGSGRGVDSDAMSCPGLRRLPRGGRASSYHMDAETMLVMAPVQALTERCRNDGTFRSSPLYPKLAALCSSAGNSHSDIDFSDRPMPGHARPGCPDEAPGRTVVTITSSITSPFMLAFSMSADHYDRLSLVERCGIGG